MRCRYETMKEKVHPDEMVEYKTYGIRVMVEIASVSDVSLDKAFVDELCRKFNESELSPLRLLDMIDKSM